MIQVSPFMGELPKIADRLIPGEYATLAENCDLESRSLQGALGQTSVISLATGTKSIFRHPQEGKWMRFDQPDVSVVRSPLNNDNYDRVYWTGDNTPKMAPYNLALGGSTPPSTSYRLGIPAPSSAPVAADATGTAPDGAIEIDAAYVVTFISEYGEEGPPSPASQLAVRWEGATIELSSIPVPPTGPYNITSKRLYRAETGGAYLFVADIPAANTAYSDDIQTDALGAEIPSTDWDMPPDNLTGLMHIGNGIMAGWFDNTLCFSETYRPHAWPIGFQLGFASNIVGIAPVSSGLIVVTEQGPWLVSGGSPAAMSQFKLDIYLGAVSRRSVVDMGEYAIYASGEGLVAVGGSQAQVITQNLLTREQWQQFNPQSIIAFRWHDKYLAFYTKDDNTTGAFLINEQMGLVRYDVPNIVNAWLDETDGQIYLLKSNAEVIAWDKSTTRTQYTWKSKVFTLPRRDTMPVAKVDGLQEIGDTINLKIWADGELLHEQEVDSTLMIRLPSGRYRTWQFQVSGTAEIFSVQIAQSPSALR